MTYHTSMRRVAADRITDECTRALLGSRTSRTQRRSPYLAQLERDIKGGRKRPVAMIVNLLLDAQDHGEPQEAVEAFAYTLLVALRARRPDRPVLPIRTANDAETDIDCALDRVQMRLQATPDDPALLAEAADLALAHSRALSDFAVSLSAARYGTTEAPALRRA